MADFTTLTLDANRGTQGTPVWVSVLGANKETRWSDSNAQNNVASASWPAMIRPGSTQNVAYTYAFTADATGDGYIGSSGGTVPSFSNSNYNWGRWNWDNTGTFASAPIMTSYPTTAHGSITRGDNSLLGGNTTDTGATQRSYLKANIFGRVDSAGAPAAAPTNAPVVTDGATGSVSPTAGANWATNYQGLQGDNDYLTFPNTPAATTADTQHCIFALFTGPNMTPSTYTVVITLKYTWT